MRSRVCACQAGYTLGFASLSSYKSVSQSISQSFEADLYTWSLIELASESGGANIFTASRVGVLPSRCGQMSCREAARLHGSKSYTRGQASYVRGRVDPSLMVHVADSDGSANSRRHLLSRRVAEPFHHSSPSDRRQLMSFTIIHTELRRKSTRFSCQS